MKSANEAGRAGQSTAHTRTRVRTGHIGQTGLDPSTHQLTRRLGVGKDAAPQSAGTAGGLSQAAELAGNCQVWAISSLKLKGWERTWQFVDTP